MNYNPSEAQKAAPPEVWRAIAEAITALEGLRWKYWVRDATGGEAGGLYLFETFDQAGTGSEWLRKSLYESGAGNISARLLEVDAGLSALTGGAVPDIT